MKTNKTINALLAVLGLTALLGSGCTSVMKQNITSTVNTGIGISVAPNQNQVHEIKVGYIRSQFYSIPTGKTFDEAGNPTSNDAKNVPQLVSGIKMHSGIDNLIVGMDVSENFAVGNVAVNSKAATAMYIASAKDPKSAKAASEAVLGTDSGAETSKYIMSKDHQQQAETLNDLRKKTLTSDQKIGDKTYKSGSAADVYANDLAEEKGDTLLNIMSKPSRASDLQDIIKQLQDATK